MNNILLTSFYAVYFCEICRICAKFEMPVSSISAVWSHSKGVVVVFLHGGVEVGRWTGPFLWLVFCWQGCASTPQDKTQLDNLRQAAEDLRLATEAAAAGTLRKQLLTALQVTIHTQMQIVSMAIFRLNWDCLIAPLILFFSCCGPTHHLGTDQSFSHLTYTIPLCFPQSFLLCNSSYFHHHKMFDPVGTFLQALIQTFLTTKPTGSTPICSLCSADNISYHCIVND